MYKIGAVHFHLLGSKLMVFMQRQRMKDLLLRALIVVETSKRKIQRRRLADDVKKLHKKACHTCSTIIFPHSLICGNVVVIAVVISLTLIIVDIAVDCKINGLVETSFK